jgi:hypothetical protein
MSGDIPPLPQYTLMAWCSVKAQGQLYLYLTFNPFRHFCRTPWMWDQPIGQLLPILKIVEMHSCTKRYWNPRSPRAVQGYKRVIQGTGPLELRLI